MNNQAMMVTKVKNIYIMLLHAISKENISIVDHYIDDDLATKINNYIENNKTNNVKQVFRQQNISNVDILNESDDCITIRADIKHITYFVDRTSNNYVYGDNQTRKKNTITLKFRKNNIQAKAIIHCPSCGAGLKINNSAICSYCGESLDESYSHYVLCSIE